MAPGPYFTQFNIFEFFNNLGSIYFRMGLGVLGMARRRRAA